MNIKNKIFASLLMVSMTLSSISFGQDYNPDAENPEESDYNSPDVSLTLPPMPAPSKSEPDVGEAVSPMKKGQTAPFTGLLFSPAATATIIADVESKHAEIRIEVQKALAEADAKHEREMTIAKIRGESDSKIDKLRIENQQKDITRLELQLKQEREDRPNTLMWTFVGVGAGIILSTLTTAMIVSVANHN